MKIRKLFSAVLALCLAASLATPALAAGAADQRLIHVTQVVKTILEVADDYEEFYGEPDETMLGARWRLSWTAPDKSLYVTATEEGKVLSVSRWESEPTVEKVGSGPVFPARSWTECKAIAQDFLETVLTAGEEAQFDQETGVGYLGATSYYFRGSILLNGLDTPLSFSVRVNVNNGLVTTFWRDDPADYVGQVPAPETVTTVDKARVLLRETLKFELIYVRDLDGERAVLRYVPRATDEFYVDAATGELVNLTELRRALFQESMKGGSFMDGDMMASPEMSNSSFAQLSPTEMEGIAKLEGVLDQEGLDAKARAWTELGLDGFELAQATYRVERKTQTITTVIDGLAMTEIVEEPEDPANTKVTASLTYVKRTEEGISRRNLTMDAKTGELESLSGYNSYVDEEATVTLEEAQAKAEAFLEKLWPDQLTKCEVYTSHEGSKISDAHSFTFAQYVNGHFFPENTLTVQVSARDGSIMGAYKSFDDEVEFDDAEDLVDLDTAKAAWADSYALELAYLAIPVKLDLLGQEAQPLMKAGYSYYNALRPGYAWGEQEGWYLGVDAKTGQVVRRESSYVDLTVTYDDIEGHWAQMYLEQLAEYNVGWLGGKAAPDEAMTQLDYMALLASAEGYVVDLTQEGAADDLYQYAIGRGLITEAEREDGKVLTRGETVKILLKHLGYGPIAELKGIFRCDFTDAETIPAELMGYAALAQGLGLVTGDTDGSFGAQRPTARCEAAVLLWRYLSR